MQSLDCVSRSFFDLSHWRELCGIRYPRPVFYSAYPKEVWALRVRRLWILHVVLSMHGSRLHVCPVDAIATFCEAKHRNANETWILSILWIFARALSC